MLVLTRFVGERIMIGDNVTVTVVDVRGNKVKLGFDAPREVEVHREEVFEEIRRQEKGIVE